MEREVGGGIGMGNTCEPKAFSFQCMTKFTTNKKIKIKKKRKKITNYITLKKKKSWFLSLFELYDYFCGKLLFGIPFAPISFQNVVHYALTYHIKWTSLAYPHSLPIRDIQTRRFTGRNQHLPSMS